jgi:DNA polymerase
MALICSLDYETSAPLDLTVVGAYRYAPSAKIMCAGYAIYEENTFEPGMVKPWRAWQGEPMPADLLAALSDESVRKFAWNAQFERLITLHAAGLAVPQEQWFCTAARARASAYPGKLDLCAKALAIPQKKDLAGGKLMKKLSTEGTGTEEEYERVLEYCLQDVVVEATIGMVIRDMTAEEWQDYWVCERMNDRGIPIDAELARAAQKYAAVEAAEIAKELNAATGGAITSAKQFARIKQWVAVKAPEIAEQFTDEETGKFSLDRSARTAIFESDLQISEEVREVLELIDDAGRASTAKYAAIENRTDTDGRLRGAYLFNGAGQTGRFSAMGFQPHNLVRDKLDNAGDVIEAVLDGASAAEVTKLSGQNMLTTLARMLRPTIVAENGNVLAWADYSAVEARALPWLSASPAAEPLLDIFRKNEDVYKHAAMGIYGVPFDKVDKAQRQMGKIAVLALGYQGGKNAFRKMARAYGLKIGDDLADEIKVAWRLANPWAKTFWRDLEGAAVRAARNPGIIETAGRIKYLMHGDMLYALLPCGRLIAYPEVEVVEVDGKYGPQARVSSLKASMHPKKGETAWPRVTLYGGLLAENATQAFCASLLRAAVRRLDEAGWPVVMHTHDEVLVEVAEDEVDDAKAALQEAMLSNAWPDLPLAADPEHGYSYDK